MPVPAEAKYTIGRLPVWFRLGRVRVPGMPSLGYDKHLVYAGNISLLRLCYRAMPYTLTPTGQRVARSPLLLGGFRRRLFIFAWKNGRLYTRITTTNRSIPS